MPFMSWYLAIVDERLSSFPILGWKLEAQVYLLQR